MSKHWPRATGTVVPWRRSRPWLTPRRRQVLALVADGRTDQHIADQLGVSKRTVGRHLEDIRALLGARDRTHAVVLAYRARLIDLDAPAAAPSHSIRRVAT